MYKHIVKEGFYQLFSKEHTVRAFKRKIAFGNI